MPNFFVKPEQIAGDRILITGEDAKHLNVLRCKARDKLQVSDGAGQVFACEIEELSKAQAELRVVQKFASDGEPAVKVFLFQAMPKGDKMELIIQKCVELGIYEIIPVVTENVVAKPNEKSERKTERLQKISEAAAMQSERGIIPKVREPVKLSKAFEMLEGMDEAYVAYERETDCTAVRAFQSSKGERIGILVGPEGGFSGAEIEECERRNVKSVSLGKRILRTETAGFKALITLLIFREEMLGGHD